MTESERQRRGSALLLALSGGMDIRAAAKVANCSEATARRRMQRPEFRARLAEMQRQALEAATAKLSSAAGQAVDTLVGLMSNPHPLAALSAAKAVLEQLVRFRQQVELEEKVRLLAEELARLK